MGWQRWTAYLRFENGDVEEIDVNALDKVDALRRAKAEAEQLYRGTFEIVEVRR
jgi:hypothetical protein